MDKRRPISEIPPDELITRLNNANSKLNERCTMYKMTLERKNKVMDDMWKRNTQSEIDNEILQDTINILQETIDSVGDQLAKKLNLLAKIETDLNQLEDDMDYYPEEFEFFDAHEEVRRIAKLSHISASNPPEKENKT